MANMTRAQMVAELKSRGWSRFTDADLQRYLDWALQDLYSKSKFDRSVLSITPVVGTTLDTIPFTTISGDNAELVNEVSAVYIVQTGQKPKKLIPATEKEFQATVWPNAKASAAIKDTGVPRLYYVYDLNLYLYPAPLPAVDIQIHYMLREDLFTSDSDITGLPERFDKGVIALAEIHCNRRSHNHEELGVAQAVFDQFLLEEMGMAGLTMGEAVSRVEPWRG